MYTLTYRHAYIHTTYIHSCMHACIHTYIHNCIHAYEVTNYLSVDKKHLEQSPSKPPKGQDVRVRRPIFLTICPRFQRPAFAKPRGIRLVGRIPKVRPRTQNRCRSFHPSHPTIERVGRKGILLDVS